MQQLSSEHSPFESIKRVDDRGEWWSARDLAKILGYSEYRNFKPVLVKGMEACKNSDHLTDDHFVEFHDMVEIGSGAKRSVHSVRLTRYACYLIIQNADPSKEVVAHGQTYFAVQTRKQEIREIMEDEIDPEDLLRLEIRERLRDHNKHLAAAARESGVVTPVEYATFQNHGYQGLYGGLNVREIKERKDLSNSPDWLDHINSQELAANLFRATQTEAILRRDQIQGKTAANKLHFEVGREVRRTIRRFGNEMPEDLKSAPDLKKVRARLQKPQGEQQQLPLK